MDALQELAELEAREQAERDNRYAVAVKRYHEGDSTLSAVEVRDAMQGAGKSREDFERDVRKHKVRAELVRQKNELPGLEEQLADLQARFNEIAGELRAAQEKLQQARDTLGPRIAELERKIGTAQEAKAKLRTAEFACPVLASERAALEAERGRLNDELFHYKKFFPDEMRLKEVEERDRRELEDKLKTSEANHNHVTAAEWRQKLEDLPRVIQARRDRMAFLQKRIDEIDAQVRGIEQQMA